MLSMASSCSFPVGRRYWRSSTGELNETGKKLLHCTKEAREGHKSLRERMQLHLMETRGPKEAATAQLSADSSRPQPSPLSPQARETPIERDLSKYTKQVKLALQAIQSTLLPRATYEATGNIQIQPIPKQD